jgi:hypothetical protein
MPRKIDWNYYREKYIFGGDSVTYESLSTLPNAPAIDTIKRNASKYNWTQQRLAYRHKTATKTQERVSSTEAEATARHVRISQQLQGVALERLKQAQQGNEKIPLSDVRQWLKDALEIEREALGLNHPTIQIQREVKLQLKVILDELRANLQPVTLAEVETVLARAMVRQQSETYGAN